MDEKRIAKWDNLKFYLILLVAMGHITHYYLDYSELAKTIYLFIYSFHMPVFMFIAGLFSKHAVKQCRFETVFQYLIIYVVMKFLDSLADTLAGGSGSFHFLWESGPGWFALALAVFTAVTMATYKLGWRVMIPASVMVGCLAGLDSHFGDHFASMRICVFYPVFIAGFYIDKELFTTLQEGIYGVIQKITSCILIAAMIYVMYTKIDTLYPLIRLFKGKYAYDDMGLGIEGVIVRFGCYVFWGLMIYVLVALAPSGRRFYTWLGSRTMAIFTWHNFFISMIMNVLGIASVLYSRLPHTYVICALCIAFIVAVICAYLPEFRVRRQSVDRHI